MKSYETPVKSFFHTRSTRYGVTDSTFPLLDQLKRFRDSFAISDGKTGTIDFEPIGRTRIDYEGQLTLVSSMQDGSFQKNYCSGPDVTIVNYPSSLVEFRERLTSQETLKNAAFCLSTSGYNFHHFLFEVLPSLLTFKKELEVVDTLLLGASQGSSFIKEFNKVLHFHKSIQLLPLRSSLEIEEAFAITSFPFRIYPVDVLEDIRLQVTVASKESAFPQGAEICFIGRADRDRNRRNLVNESDVLNEVSGFFGSVLVVRPGITELLDTVAQVTKARVIVGMLGGSLAHLVWARSLELFIEIVPYGYFGATETEELAKIFGFEYRRVTSTDVGTGGWSWADQECDIEELQGVLEKLEIKSLH